MRLALCQLNPTVGDLAGNAALVLDAARRAADAGADLAVFPELVLTGYPPQDLLDRPAFLDAADDALAHVVAHAPAGLGLVLGVTQQNRTRVGRAVYNAAVVVDGGAVVGHARKMLLPTYDVFDEHRYFEAGTETAPVAFRGLRLGLHVCEDLWNNAVDVSAATHDALVRPGAAEGPRFLYRHNPIDLLGAAGIDLFVNVSASPFAAGKPAERLRLMRESVAEWGVPFVYVNTAGANTELVFDGDSQAVGADGAVLARAQDFAEDLVLWDLPDGETADGGRRTQEGSGTSGTGGAAPDPIPSIHDALVVGIRDYVRKTGDAVFPTALVGLSGGIDSAVTCALAVEALGADRVVGITMPSKYSSTGSVTDAQALAENLGIAFHEVSIRPAVDAFEAMLAPLFAGTAPGVAEENIQARARGVTLMAVSNKTGALLLTTGNKSEMGVGYATLYGDMSGGLAVLSDVFKTDVYRLAEHINDRARARTGRGVIPQNTITKPPSAELRPGQTDQDSLPPYDVLDAILRHYVEGHLDVDAIVAATGFERALVARVAGMVDRNEYKRRQAAPGLRVSGKAFGVGRRLPIVMRRTVVSAPVNGR